MIVIDEKLKPSDKVLRYMSFDKFIDIVHNNKIYLARADLFEDGFEGNYTKLIYEISKGITIDSCNQGMVNNTKHIRESAYVSCWTLSDFENMALWKLYGGGGNNTIAIETTIEALENDLQASEFYPGEFTKIYSLGLFKVDYIDHNSDADELMKELLSNKRMPLRKKAMAYSYESEVRIIIDHLNVSPSVGQELQRKLGIGINLNVNIDKLISKIYVSPLADEWFYDLLKSMLKNYGISDLVSWSNMRQTPVQEVFG